MTNMEISPEPVQHSTHHHVSSLCITLRISISPGRVTVTCVNMTTYLVSSSLLGVVTPVGSPPFFSPLVRWPPLVPLVLMWPFEKLSLCWSLDNFGVSPVLRLSLLVGDNRGYIPHLLQQAPIVNWAAVPDCTHTPLITHRLPGWLW